MYLASRHRGLTRGGPYLVLDHDGNMYTVPLASAISSDERSGFLALDEVQFDLLIVMALSPTAGSIP